MAIKHVCDRCGDVSDEHKIYSGRYLAFNTWSRVVWYRETLEVCCKCYEEFKNWLDNK